MRSFERVYELTQQTPMIHFQYGEHGATLRATEVKPKLDKYIRKRCEVKKEWKLGDTEALNYRMTITAPDENPEISKNAELKKDCKRMRGKKERDLLSTERYYPQINKMYFGNMVEGNLSLEDYCNKVDETFKETVFYKKEKIVLAVICMIPELLEAIDKYIEDFFLVTNFGTRQTKGFGGFLITAFRNSNRTPIKEEKICERYSELGCIGFYIGKYSKTVSTNSLMNTANNIYSIMKGGISQSRIDGYIKNQYLNDIKKSGFGNESDFIEEIVFTQSDEDTSGYRFMRALLGLPDNYSFQKGKHAGETIKIYCLGEDSFDIKRMASPVTIKIVCGYVIFLFKEQKEILKKEFYFMNSFFENELKAKKSYADKADFIKAKGKMIVTPGVIKWEKFIRGFKKYLSANTDYNISII